MKEKRMAKDRLWGFLIIGALFIVGCASAPPPVDNSGPPRAGYDKGTAMEQERNQQPDEDEIRRRKAAGEMLPGLIEMRNKAMKER